MYLYMNSSVYGAGWRCVPCGGPSQPAVSPVEPEHSQYASKARKGALPIVAPCRAAALSRSRTLGGLEIKRERDREREREKPIEPRTAEAAESNPVPTSWLLDRAGPDQYRGGLITSALAGPTKPPFRHARLSSLPHDSVIVQVSPFTIPALLGNTAAGVIAIETGAQGPNFGIVSACATATHCLGEALQAIREGEVGAVVWLLVRCWLGGIVSCACWLRCV